MTDQPSIYRLIAIYWDRYAELDAATTKLDEIEEGSPAQKKVDAAFIKASARVKEALVDVCSYLPTWTYEAKIKARFIAGTIDYPGTDLEPEAVQALIHSASKLVLPTRQGATS